MTTDEAAIQRGAWRRGARAALPLIPGAVLFGLATGAATVSAGVSQSAAFAMPAGFYSGVAQLAYAQLVAVGAPFASVLLSVALTHLRYLIYAAIASTWPRPSGLWPRIVGAYFVSESSFALALQEPLPTRYRYMIGAGAPVRLVRIGDRRHLPPATCRCEARLCRAGDRAGADLAAVARQAAPAWRRWRSWACCWCRCRCAWGRCRRMLAGLALSPRGCELR